MKFKKALKIVSIILAALILAGVLGLFIWSRTSTYPARSTSLDAMQTTENVSVSQETFIQFVPAEEIIAGLIFYPGGLVEPSAYSPVLQNLAAEGILVVIAPMPFNLAIFDTNAAQEVIDSHPSIDDWILAGHSLGGAAAAIFADSHPDEIDALIFWDSYPPNSASLADERLPVLSIFGTTNGIPNTENFDEKRFLLPNDAVFESIEGASHAQFGDYGPQKDDVIPSISLDTQHGRVTEIMLNFLSNQIEGY